MFHLTSLLFLFYFCQTSSCAYIYAYLLHNPIPDESFPSIKNDNLFADQANNNLTEVKIKCKEDSDCGDDNDLYCDMHYGYCNSLYGENELCRRDGQCARGLICIFGKCEVPAKPGHKGARCFDNQDCNANLCCARQHGEKICKNKIQKGHRCYVPMGGLDYSLNELCPCEDGLVCTKRKSKQKR